MTMRVLVLINANLLEGIGHLSLSVVVLPIDLLRKLFSFGVLAMVMMSIVVVGVMNRSMMILLVLLLRVISFDSLISLATKTLESLLTNLILMSQLFDCLLRTNTMVDVTSRLVSISKRMLLPLRNSLGLSGLVRSLGTILLFRTMKLSKFVPLERFLDSLNLFTVLYFDKTILNLLSMALTKFSHLGSLPFFLILLLNTSFLSKFDHLLSQFLYLPVQFFNSWLVSSLRKLLLEIV